MGGIPPDADVVFVVDNTGSMIIAIAKGQLAITEVMKTTLDRHYGVVTYLGVPCSDVCKMEIGAK